ILQQLQGWQRPVAQLPPQATRPETEHPLLALLWAAPHSSEALAVASGWPLARVLAELTELELSRPVACPAGTWSGLAERAASRAIRACGTLRAFSFAERVA